jgi:hypothetical protein
MLFQVHSRFCKPLIFLLFSLTVQCSRYQFVCNHPRYCSAQGRRRSASSRAASSFWAFRCSSGIVTILQPFASLALSCTSSSFLDVYAMYEYGLSVQASQIQDISLFIGSYYSNGEAGSSDLKFSDLRCPVTLTAQAPCRAASRRASEKDCLG